MTDPAAPDLAIVERLRGYEALLVDYAGPLERSDDFGDNVLGNDLREVSSAFDPTAQCIEILVQALEGLVQAVERDAHENNSISGLTGALLSDARDALAKVRGR